jgi:hypothetical protein
MAYITCSNCGAKALAVASRCPRCQHPFPTREEQRASMPVRKPAPKAPWYLAGLVLLLGAGGYVAWSTAKKAAADRKAAAARIVPVEPAPAPDTTAGKADSAAMPVDTTASMVAPSAAVAASTAPKVTAPVTTTPAAPRAKAPVTSTPPVQVAPPAPRREVADSGTWQRAVVTIAVNIREKPDRASKTLLVLHPADVVLLGEAITGWRRVKVDGIDGWVDPRHLAIRPKTKP